jgi:hypothetical protein
MNRLFRLFPLALCVSFLTYAGCSGSDEPAAIDCSKSDLAVTFESVNPQSCAVVNGTITATATGGKAPYTYALNTGSFSANEVFTQLSAGDYILRVKDKNGCTVQSSEVQLRIPGNDLNAAITTELDTECVNNNGSVTVIATGGTQPYQFKIGNGSFGDIATFTLLATGNHTVTIKDAAGCLFPKPIFIDRGDTGTSLEDEIMPILQTKCAIDNCHNGGEQPNLTDPQNVLTHAAKIKQLTQSGEMPKEGSLTTAQKTLIACWVDDGAKDN